MTDRIDIDRNAEKTAYLPFEPADMELTGIRVLPAQLAKLIGVSKKAVSNWVRGGRVVLGNDGRVDPSAAMARLLMTGDPARLRAKALRPMVAELDRYKSQISNLEAKLAKAQIRITELSFELDTAREESEFQSNSANSYAELFAEFRKQILCSWEALAALPDGRGADLIDHWLEAACQVGSHEAGQLLGAPGDTQEGGGK